MEGPWRKIAVNLDKQPWRYDWKYCNFFLHLLLNVNHKKGWLDDGSEIYPDELATSIASLHKKLGISKRSVRTIINNLKNRLIIDKRSTNKYTVLKLLESDIYEPIGQASDKQNDKQATTILEYRDKNINKKKSKSVEQGSTSHPPDLFCDESKQDLETQKGNAESPTQRIISDVVSYLNDKVGTGYRPKSKSTVASITRLLNLKYEHGDLTRVIDKKCKDWLGTEYQGNLNPRTLFRESNFEIYYNQSKMEQAKSKGGDVDEDSGMTMEQIRARLEANLEKAFGGYNADNGEHAKDDN